jgi:hypothetical protein
MTGGLSWAEPGFVLLPYKRRGAALYGAAYRGAAAQGLARVLIGATRAPPLAVVSLNRKKSAYMIFKQVVRASNTLLFNGKL